MAFLRGDWIRTTWNWFKAFFRAETNRALERCERCFQCVPPEQVSRGVCDRCFEELDHKE